MFIFLLLVCAVLFHLESLNRFSSAFVITRPKKKVIDWYVNERQFADGKFTKNVVHKPKCGRYLVLSLISRTKQSLDTKKESECDVGEQKHHGNKRNFSALRTWINESQGVYLNSEYIHLSQESSLLIEELDNVTSSSWGVTVSQDASRDTVVICIPSNLILSSNHIESELNRQLEPNITMRIRREFITLNRLSDLSQFYLFVKLLMERERGTNSLWYHWIKSLPRSFETAVCMNDAELECLPTFAYAMAQNCFTNWNLFQKVIPIFPLLSDITKNDTILLRWAFNVVYSRSWHQHGCNPGRPQNYNTQDNIPIINSGEVEKLTQNHFDLVPLGDMFNHGVQNVNLNYNNDRDVVITLKNDTTAGSALHLNYGKPTNPYWFLTVFGFVDENQSKMFLHLVVSNPTKRDIEMGYDPANLLIDVQSGFISSNAMYFVLYMILAQKPDIQDTFYKAQMSKNHDLVHMLYKQYHLETCIILRQHVDRVIQEMNILHSKIMTLNNDAPSELLQLIRQNNEFVTKTFHKAKTNLSEQIKMELMERKLRD